MDGQKPYGVEDKTGHGLAVDSRRNGRWASRTDQEAIMTQEGRYRISTFEAEIGPYIVMNIERENVCSHLLDGMGSFL